MTSQRPLAEPEAEMMTSSKPYHGAGIDGRRSRGYMCCAVRWSFSPHPSPLPWGEGEPCSPRRTIQISRLSAARCSLFPAHGPGANPPTGDPSQEGNGPASVAPLLGGVGGGFSGTMREQNSGNSLPEGEGQGEGKRRERGSRVSDLSRVCRTGRVSVLVIFSSFVVRHSSFCLLKT